MATIELSLVTSLHPVYIVSKIKEANNILYETDKFRCTVAIFGRQHHESDAKLIIRLVPSSSNQCGYFTLHHIIKLAKHKNYCGFQICQLIMAYENITEEIVKCAANLDNLKHQRKS